MVPLKAVFFAPALSYPPLSPHNLYRKNEAIQGEVRSLIEIEHEFHDMIKDLSHEEKRIFSSLLRADGPLSLSFMLGIQYDDFIHHMKCLGKKIHEHCCKKD